MKNPKLRAAKLITFTLMVAVVAIVGCAPPARDEVNPANERLAGAVKAALVRADAVEAAPVDVVADTGVVTLSGFVDSDGEAATAVAVARAEPGVARVVNRLRVR